LPEEIRHSSALREEVPDPEMGGIRQALQESGHNVSEAAQSLSISRATLYRKIKKYDL
jgi:transcriptional regulator with PAS, ATPase and Fis domain